ncbi:sulfurtransferase complex subunit TusB [Candidatus Venteria ishoeyi]|uniref:Protein TusB n=1 Tax=Candidatus Venteria ishoeyi TaxID=1899563 RepID=A0A1H6FEB2_9GAMM|nr:sulfurtransferase complex subunit TusB [Candidatus Venteria ishoeyi]MDM8547555.1 sulfurtransferase complex subunit TusB [Candidatus Venteria ishoeyi]SEH08377.1 Protein TusB [Candidatus Venteria ishoeyi]
MLLHTVNKSPFEKNSLETCLSLAKAGSSVLLIEDGVYAVQKGSQADAMISDALKTVNFYVLGPDLDARGMAADNMIDGIKTVDYNGFVDLVADHKAVQAWL